MSRFGYTLAILASSVLASACTDDLPSTTSDQTDGTTSGGAGDTFDHDDTQTISPWDLLNRLETQGPPEYTAHVHACPKVRYKTLNNVLVGVGTDMTGSGATDPGTLYAQSPSALGYADYSNRIRENVAITTSGMSREFDIFAAAAPSVIAAFQSLTTATPNAALAARCGSGPTAAQLFDTTTTPTTCKPDGISCLIGVNASTDYVNYCNLTIKSSSSDALGQQLAVAVVLASAYTCE
jgi:hypothetical protein